MQDQFDIDWSFFVVAELIAAEQENLIGKTCLDIGSGAGVHTEIFRKAGMTVTQLDKYQEQAEIQADFLTHCFDDTFDYIFCSHVIEHQRNCGSFLDKIFDTLNDNGKLILSAPKHSALMMVEGHINSFVMPILVQQLVYAGFDVRSGKLLSCAGIENSVIVGKDPDFHVIERLSDAYQWTDRHQLRSPFELKDGLDFDNEKVFFQNCDLWSGDKDGKVIFNSALTQRRGITIRSTRWNISLNL